MVSLHFKSPEQVIPLRTTTKTLGCLSIILEIPLFWFVTFGLHQMAKPFEESGNHFILLPVVETALEWAQGRKI